MVFRNFAVLYMLGLLNLGVGDIFEALPGDGSGDGVGRGGGEESVLPYSLKIMSKSLQLSENISMCSPKSLKVIQLLQNSLKIFKHAP